MEKICKKCNNIKDESCFREGRYKCFECFNEERRARYVKKPIKPPITIKTCTKCKLIGELNLFDGNLCRSCKKEYNKKYWSENSWKNVETKKEYDKVYAIENEEKMRIKKANWYQDNKEILIERRKVRLNTDPIFRLHFNLSNLLRHHFKLLKKSKEGKSSNKLLEFLIKDIKEKFDLIFLSEVWMTWNNQGIYNPLTWDDSDQSTWKWQLDHIKPVSHFKNIIDENSAEFKECWSLKNLRPLSAKQNISEQDNRSPEQIQKIYDEIEEKLKQNKK
jgi:hypothetical protein